MEKRVFENETVLTRNEEDFLTTEVDGETVIMNSETGHYFGFNSVTTDIWNHLSSPIAFKELIAKLIKEYEVEQETCEKETRPVLARMLQLKIIAKEDK